MASYTSLSNRLSSLATKTKLKCLRSKKFTLVILCKFAEKVEEFLQIFAPCHKCVLSLIVHLFSDTMTFELVAHNNSLLICQVNVSAHPGFVLSILHNGDKIHKLGCWESACNLAAQPSVMLSGTISLTLGGKYECQLHLMQHLITKKVYTSILPGNSITSHSCSYRHVATTHQL